MKKSARGKRRLCSHKSPFAIRRAPLFRTTAVPVADCSSLYRLSGPGGKGTEAQRGRFARRLEKGLSDDGMHRREVTNRIGAGGIAGQEEGLATAAPEIDLAPRAAPTGLRHPLRAAEALEDWS